MNNRSSEQRTWQYLLDMERQRWNDITPIVHVIPNSGVLAIDNGSGFRDYGGNDAPPWMAWSTLRVYFPTEYDGAEGISSAPRYLSEVVEGYK